ncbi:protein cereblon isoform X1 [Chiloscyllium punctatum]|uniref:protein cereblon isoform X1 n=1 Tax=Chiloscyllium punctatum TaxID=137246 RepID=UPI003B632ACE
MWQVLVPLLLGWLLPAVSGHNASQEERSSPDELLLCRSCGFEVAASRDLKFVASALALAQRNDTVIGERRVPVQLFQNPQGLRFQVLTFKKAAVHRHWPAEEQFSWFPGHSWTVATCPRCHNHLGWSFQPSIWPQHVTDEKFEDSDETFVALIIDRLLQENFAATLLMVPKSYRS